ncbi:MULTISPECIES: beta-lactamase regulator AmpE [Shewanella]|uniref:Signaling modulator of AmpD, AmpE n=1 Tax=Shewanella sp. (strain MR-7) TaxID=60481 RepID=Q0HQM4_SHESR|nr:MULTISPECIES: beta-lactamase regulator AmpE [Shewanella]QXN24623.1 beta-lactamase regulator AmpE [Shewanella putrefaciens]MCL1122486.1 beta-lactamase regulator AmpE [Shewanella seohaensis]MDH0447039.1 beta-lactamase regulator AmpE [Shewanella sp. GD04112]MDH1468797.1 beta-lactamase regulator AmpE [Shewanella sp. GD03713]UXM82176.1 beta-lactamase regulator AmpE [Shewanella seohaensis]
MALFSLLVAILVERLKFLPASWQCDRVLQSYQSTFFGDKASLTNTSMLLALVLPALVVHVLGWVASGMFWGLLTLALWVVVAIICFNHQKQRDSFKKYMQAACRSDVQACYHYAAELDCSECLDAVSEKDLGAKVGQSVAWINYRYYGAVALCFIFLGPVGAVLYCTARFYAEENVRKSLNLPLIEDIMFVLDWIPSRVFSFGYALSGQFSEGLSAWRDHALNINASARRVVTETALASQPLPEESSAPVCVQSTLALLVLSKRNFTLMVAVLSLLTIFGLVT